MRIISELCSGGTLVEWLAKRKDAQNQIRTIKQVPRAAQKWVRERDVLGSRHRHFSCGKESERFQFRILSID